MLLCGFGWAQQAASAVDGLRARLMEHNGQAVMKVGEVHAATKVLLHPIDNRVVNGSVQQRNVAGFFRGSDDQVIPVGQTVRVVKVESSSDGKNDVIRVTVATPGNALAPIAFVLPSGSLAGMTESQLEQTVSAVVSPIAAAASGTQTVRTPVARPAAGPPGWRFVRTQTGTEALLQGEVEANGTKEVALLAFGCPTLTSVVTGVNAGQLVAELRVRKSMLTFGYGNLVMEGGSDNDVGRSQLGAEPEIHIDLAADQVGEAAIAPLSLRYEEPDLRHVVDTPGLPLTLKAHEVNATTDAFVAHFQLPPNSSAVQRLMQPCFAQAEASAAQAEQGKKLNVVLACPDVEGKALRSGKVLVGAAGKELEMDPDSEGTSWALPKATKTRARPKLVLACFYGAPGYGSDLKETLEKKTFSIPATAAYCSRGHRTTGNIEEVRCDRASK